MDIGPIWATTQTRAGVVVLSNVSTAAGPDDIGLHLLDASYPLEKVEPIKEHKETTIDSKVFDNYVGSYFLPPNAIMAISRDGDRFFAKLTGQQRLQIYPETERKFFLKVVDAQLSFDTDAQGKATQLTLHQNARDRPARRIDEAEGAALLAALAKRFKDQTPVPGSQAALLRNIDELREGKPKYELMTPARADMIREQLPQLKSFFNELGAVQSVAFKSVTQGGGDVYEVKFAHGSVDFTVTMGLDGNIYSVSYKL